MSYDQKALEKLFAKKSDTSEINNMPAVEPVGDPEQDPVVQLVAEKLPDLKADSKQIVELPISDLTDYPKQLFKPYTEEKLNRLETSIRENGVIEPLIVRLFDSKYQIVCGHNRKRAAAQAGFESLPCIVEILSDDEADIKMVETNLQTRTGLLPSEKGFAYKLKLEALKHQGMRTDLTSGSNVPEVNRKLSREILSEQVSESERQIANYIRITFLISPLLDLVDNNSLPIRPAVELSYMNSANQEEVYNYFFVQHKLYINELLAKQLKERSRIEELTQAVITDLLPHSQGKTVKQTSRFQIPAKPLMKLLDTNALTKDVEKEILDVLIDYFKKKKIDKE